MPKDHHVEVWPNQLPHPYQACHHSRHTRQRSATGTVHVYLQHMRSGKRNCLTRLSSSTCVAGKASGDLHNAFFVIKQSDSSGLHQFYVSSWAPAKLAKTPLVESNFLDHRPAVYINQHLFWNLMIVGSGTFTQHAAHPAPPILLTKNVPRGGS